MRGNTKENINVGNIYQLNGRVPISKAIPFGLQHILAMFVSNLTPIILIAASSGMEQEKVATLLQNAMFMAGIATIIQLYPLGRVGAKLPIVMGVSFTFVTLLSYIGAQYGYDAVVGSVIVGGLLEGTLGLMAKYWRRIITPVVAGIVVTTIGYSLLSVGVRSFGGGYSEDFGSVRNLMIGTITIVSVFVVQYFCKIILETIVGTFWSACRLHSIPCNGNGEFIRNLGKWNDCFSTFFAGTTGV